MDKEQQDCIEKFNNAPKAVQIAMMFDSMMEILGDAVASNDIKRIKTSARLATEMWDALQGKGE